MSAVDAMAASPATGHPLRWRTLAVTQLAAFMALLFAAVVTPYVVPRPR